jgi:parallel beta-helix repeat protein
MAINLERFLKAKRFTADFTLDDATDQVKVKASAVSDALSADPAALNSLAEGIAADPAASATLAGAVGDALAADPGATEGIATGIAGSPDALASISEGIANDPVASAFITEGVTSTITTDPVAAGAFAEGLAASPEAMEALGEGIAGNEQAMTAISAELADVFVLSEDLASTDAGKGAELVGFKQAGSGAVDRTARAKMRETVSIQDFGQIGTADDTTVVQAAINSAAASGSKLIATSGNYTVGGLTIPGPLVLEGNGAKFIAKTAIGQNNMFTAVGIDGITITGCEFDMRNDVITGTRSNSFLENILCLTSCSNVLIEDNKFSKAIYHNIIFNASLASECRNVYIRNNTFLDGTSGAVLLARYGRNFHISGNKMDNVCNQSRSGIAFDKSISLSGVIGAWISNNYVQQDVAGGGTIIIEYTDRQSENVTIENNVIVGLADNSIKLGASVDVRVVGNSCINSTAVGIYVEGCADVLIDGNYISGSNKNAVRVYEDDPSQTGRANKNITIVNNIFKNSNVGGYTLGAPGGAVGSDNSYHIACRQTQYIYIRNNVFVDNSTPTASGIWMQGQQYYIEGNNFLQMKDGSITLYNAATTIGSAYNIEGNAGMQTTGAGTATIPIGSFSVAVAPDVVAESTNAKIFASLSGAMSGTAAYFQTDITGTGTFRIITRTSTHGAATATAATNFAWSYSVTDAIGLFGKTAQ